MSTAKVPRFPTCPPWCVTDHVGTQDDGAIRVHYSAHRVIRGGGQRSMCIVRLVRTDVGGEAVERVTGAVRLEIGPLDMTLANASALADAIREYTHLAGAR